MDVERKDKVAGAVAYVLPFIVFGMATYGGMLFRVPLSVAYSVKTILVGACLFWFWRVYRAEIRFSMDWVAVLVGVTVFVIWVGFEGYYPQIGFANERVVDMYSAYNSRVFLCIRIVGAVLVVPVMEEVFWRSFALRFLVDTDFLNVGIGQFTWFSFIVVALAFGLEHARWLPGIVAGVAYAWVLFRSGNLFSSILAHGVTNLLLGIYVIHTGRWDFW